jgi:hypothetical protein
LAGSFLFRALLFLELCRPVLKPGTESGLPGLHERIFGRARRHERSGHELVGVICTLCRTAQAHPEILAFLIARQGSLWVSVGWTALGDGRWVSWMCAFCGDRCGRDVSLSVVSIIGLSPRETFSAYRSRCVALTEWQHS